MHKKTQTELGTRFTCAENIKNVVCAVKIKKKNVLYASAVLGPNLKK